MKPYRAGIIADDCLHVRNRTTINNPTPRDHNANAMPTKIASHLALSWPAAQACGRARSGTLCLGRGPRHVASSPAATTAIPIATQRLNPRATAAAPPEVLLVGCGKYHAVSVGSAVATPAPSPVVCAGVAAGTDDVRVRIPHSMSLPEYVWMRDTSVGPVVSPLVNPEPNDEYSVHVAAVVEASSHEISAVLCCGHVSFQ